MEQTLFPLLSVIIPVYNGADHLEETITHIEKSEYKNLEILVIDDGSTDDSSAIVVGLMQKDERIRYLHQENRGIPAARNMGIEKAAGKYICFCDQDDIVEPCMYSKLIEKMICEHADIGICGTGRECSGKKSVYETVNDGLYSEDEILTHVLYPVLFQGYQYPFVESNDYLYGTVWKCIFDAEFVRKNKLVFKSFVRYEDDWIFVTESLSCADNVVTVNMTGYYWRINVKSESHRTCGLVDMAERLNKLDEYVYGYLRKRIPADVLQCFKDIYTSQHYLEMCDNLICCEKQNKIQVRKQIIKYMRDTDYKSRISCRNYMKKGLIRKNVLYYLLDVGRPNMAIRANSVLKAIENFSNNSSILIKLERSIKLRKNKRK